MSSESLKRGNDEANANAPPKVLRKDFAASHPTQSIIGGKSLTLMGLKAGSILFAPASHETLADLLREMSLREIQSRSIPPLPPWPGHQETYISQRYFSKLRHLPNDDFLSQYNINFARQVAMGSQLRLRYKQEVKLLKKSVAQVARRDQRIQATESEIKNLQALLKAEADMKKIRGG
ncbi:hypothetical protein Tco_0459960 [Tanacetum coccineum]